MAPNKPGSCFVHVRLRVPFRHWQRNCAGRSDLRSRLPGQGAARAAGRPGPAGWSDPPPNHRRRCRCSLGLRLTARRPVTVITNRGRSHISCSAWFRSSAARARSLRTSAQRSFTMSSQLPPATPVGSIRTLHHSFEGAALDERDLLDRHAVKEHRLPRDFGNRPSQVAGEQSVRLRLLAGVEADIDVAARQCDIADGRPDLSSELLRGRLVEWRLMLGGRLVQPPRPPNPSSPMTKRPAIRFFCSSGMLADLARASGGCRAPSIHPDAIHRSYCFGLG